MVDLGSLLEQLGSKDWEIARTLDRAGVTGRRQSISMCPLANFVRLYFPQAFDVVVTPTSVCVWEQRDSMPAISSQLETPRSVRSFISSFDKGDYPRLDECLDSFRSESVQWPLFAESKFVEPVPQCRVPA